MAERTVKAKDLSPGDRVKIPDDPREGVVISVRDVVVRERTMIDVGIELDDEGILTRILEPDETVVVVSADGDGGDDC